MNKYKKSNGLYVPYFYQIVPRLFIFLMYSYLYNHKYFLFLHQTKKTPNKLELKTLLLLSPVRTGLFYSRIFNFQIITVIQTVQAVFFLIVFVKLFKSIHLQSVLQHKKTKKKKSIIIFIYKKK